MLLSVQFQMANDKQEGSIKAYKAAKWITLILALVFAILALFLFFNLLMYTDTTGSKVTRSYQAAGLSAVFILHSIFFVLQQSYAETKKAKAY